MVVVVVMVEIVVVAGCGVGSWISTQTSALRLGDHADQGKSSKILFTRISFRYLNLSLGTLKGGRVYPF